MLSALNVTNRVVVSAWHRFLTRYWSVAVFWHFFFFCNIVVIAEFFAVLRCSEPYNTPLFGVNSVENWAWFQLVSRCWHSFSSCEPCACWSCCKMIEDELEFVMKFIIFEALFQQYLRTFNKIQIKDNLEAQKSG